MISDQPAATVSQAQPPLPAPWNLRDLLWGILAAGAGILVLNLAALVVNLALGGSLTKNGTVLTIFVSIQDLIIFGAAALLSVVRYRVGLDALGLRRFDTSLGCGLSAGLLVASYVARAAYSVIAAAFGYQPALQDVLTRLDTSGIGFILTFVAAAIIAPIAEETFFRGFMYGGLRGRIGVPLAMIVSTLFFTALHFTIGLFVPIFILGLFLAWLYEKTGSLYPGILLHASNNAISLVLYAVAKSMGLPGI